MKFHRGVLNRKVKGASVQSIIIGSIILGIIAGAGVSTMWDSVERAKVSNISSHIISQMQFINASLQDNFKELEAIHTQYDDGDVDYLDELISSNQLKIPPMDYFSNNAQWEINKIVEDGYKAMFVLMFNSSDQNDIKLFNESITEVGLQDGISVGTL